MSSNMNYKIGTVFLVIFVALAATEESIETISVPVVPVVIQKQASDVPGVILAIDKSVPSLEAASGSGSSESSGEVDPSQEIQLESTESNRTTRSIGNIARLLLGGNVPPDHPLVKYPEPLQGSASTMLTSGSSNVIAAVPGMNNVQPSTQQNYPAQQQQQSTSGTFQVPQFLLPNGGNNFQNPVQQQQSVFNNPQVPLMNNFQQQQQALQYQQPGSFGQPQPQGQFNGQQQQYQAPPPVQQFQTSAPGFNVGGAPGNSPDYSFAPQANLAQTGGNPFYASGEPQPQGHGSLPPPGVAAGGNPYQTNGAAYSPGSGVQYNSFASPSTFVTSSNPQQQQLYEGSGSPYQTTPTYSNQPPTWQNFQGGTGGQDPSYHSSGNNYLGSQPSATISESVNLTPQYQQSQPQPPPQPQVNFQQHPPSGNNYQPSPPLNYNNPPPQYVYPQQNNAFVPQASNYNPQPNFQNSFPNQPPPQSYNVFNNGLQLQGAPSTNTFTSAPGPSYPNINYNPNQSSSQSNAYNSPQPNAYNSQQQPQNYNTPQLQQNPSSSIAYQPSNTYNNYQPQAANSYSQPQPQSQSQPQSYQPPATSYSIFTSGGGPGQGQGGYNSQRQTQTPSSSPNNYNALSPNANSNYKAPGSGGYSSTPQSQNSYNAPNNPQRSTAGLRNNYAKKPAPLTGKNYPRSKTALTNSNSNSKYNVPPKYNSPKDGQGRPKGEYDHLRYNAKKQQMQMQSQSQSKKPVPYSASYNANVDITYDSSKAGVNYAPVTSPSTYKSSLLASTGGHGQGNVRGAKSMNQQRPPVTFKLPPSTTVTYNRYSKQTAPNPPGSAVKIYASKPNKHQRSQPRSYTSSAESSNPLKRLNTQLAPPPNRHSHSTKRENPKT